MVCCNQSYVWTNEPRFGRGRATAPVVAANSVVDGQLGSKTCSTWPDIAYETGRRMRLEVRETRAVDIAAAPCPCNERVDKAAPVKLARKLLKKQGGLSGSKFGPVQVSGRNSSRKAPGNKRPTATSAPPSVPISRYVFRVITRRVVEVDYAAVGEPRNGAPSIRDLPKYISSQIAWPSNRSTLASPSNFSIVTLPAKR